MNTRKLTGSLAIALAAMTVGMNTPVRADDAATAKSYAQSLKKLGCDHRLDGHAGHFDLTMNCPKWRDAEFPDHGAAHKWQDWLKSLGFETKHEH